MSGSTLMIQKMWWKDNVREFEGNCDDSIHAVLNLIYNQRKESLRSGKCKRFSSLIQWLPFLIDCIDSPAKKMRTLTHTRKKNPKPNWNRWVWKLKWKKMMILAFMTSPPAIRLGHSLVLTTENVFINGFALLFFFLTTSLKVYKTNETNNTTLQRV